MLVHALQILRTTRLLHFGEESDNRIGDWQRHAEVQTTGYMLPKCRRALGLRERVEKMVCEHPLCTSMGGQSNVFRDTERM